MTNLILSGRQLKKSVINTEKITGITQITVQPEFENLSGFAG